MKPDNYVTEAVLRVGEVIEVSGRRIFVQVDRNKNLSDLFFDGQLLRNVSVNGYIEIRKGFLSLIGKVEGEKTAEDVLASSSAAPVEGNGRHRSCRVERVRNVGRCGAAVDVPRADDVEVRGVGEPAGRGWRRSKPDTHTSTIAHRHHGGQSGAGD